MLVDGKDKPRLHDEIWQELMLREITRTKLMIPGMITG
jgi:hypothetical protein